MSTIVLKLTYSEQEVFTYYVEQNSIEYVKNVSSIEKPEVYLKSGNHFAIDQDQLEKIKLFKDSKPKNGNYNIV